ncbi:MAG: hypothetical protein K6G26_01890 [Lachnospiraceae bacterium]|nr:hypothetical protein [Lachnospiraceae bacterium]
MINTIIKIVTCPGCGTLLEVTTNTVNARCKYCKTIFNIKDAKDVTPDENLNDRNRLDSYWVLATNALRIKNFKEASLYFRLLCEADATPANVTSYNVAMLLNKEIAYSEHMMDSINAITDIDYKFFLAKSVYDNLIDNMKDDIAKATNYCITNDSREEKTNEVVELYKPSVLYISEIIKKIKPDIELYTFPVIKDNISSNKNKFYKLVLFIIIIVLILIIFLK